MTTLRRIAIVVSRSRPPPARFRAHGSMYVSPSSRPGSRSSGHTSRSGAVEALVAGDSGRGAVRSRPTAVAHAGWRLRARAPGLRATISHDHEAHRAVAPCGPHRRPRGRSSCPFPRQIVDDQPGEWRARSRIRPSTGHGRPGEVGVGRRTLEHAVVALPVGGHPPLRARRSPVFVRGARAGFRLRRMAVRSQTKCSLNSGVPRTVEDDQVRLHR